MIRRSSMFKYLFKKRNIPHPYANASQVYDKSTLTHTRSIYNSYMRKFKISDISW